MPVSAEIPETVEVLTPKAGIVLKSKIIKDSLENWIKMAARTNMQRIL